MILIDWLKLNKAKSVSMRITLLISIKYYRTKMVLALQRLMELMFWEHNLPMKKHLKMSSALVQIITLSMQRKLTMKLKLDADATKSVSVSRVMFATSNLRQK